MGKIKDFGTVSTNKPQGGWRPATRPVDAKEAAAAMQAGNFDGVIKLLGAKTAPDEIHTIQGHSALMACIANDAVQVAERLLRAGAHPDRSSVGVQDSTYIGCVLRRMLSGFDQPMLRLLLAHKADPNLAIYSHGPLPLAYAAKHALAGPAAILAQSGADPFAFGDDEEGEGLCALDRAFLLPDFQQAAMLWAFFPPPIEPCLMERILDRVPRPNDAMIAWMAQTWTTGLYLDI